MLSSIISSSRRSRLLCAAASAAGSQLLFGSVAKATTSPTITDCEVVPVEHNAAYSDFNTYAHFYVQWDETGQDDNTIYFYRGINSTSPMNSTASVDTGNVGQSDWEICGVVVSDNAASPPIFSPVTESGSTTSKWFYWDDAVNHMPDGHYKADPYVHTDAYEIGLQAYDGADYSDISWAGCTDGT